MKCMFFIREQIRKSPIDDLCLGLQFIPQEFANLQVTRDEFLCMKALILLNTGKEPFYKLFFNLQKLTRLRDVKLKSTGGLRPQKREKKIGQDFFSLIKLKF